MEYYQRNETALQNEKNILDNKANEWGSGAAMLFLQPGTTKVRILPPYSQIGVFFHKIVKHTIRLNNQTEVFVCPEFLNQPCSVCAKGQELTASRDEQKMKFARENLRPRERYLYNVLCYSSPPDRLGAVPEPSKVYVMECGIMVHRKIISLDQDSVTGWADITNPENGVILTIKRVGKGQYDTTYEVFPTAQRTNLFEECAARGIDPRSLQLINLEQVYSAPPDWKLEELAKSIDRVVSNNPPTPRPVLPTVSPTVAASAPEAPVVATPVPVAAPQSPQAQNFPLTQPQIPVVPVSPPVGPNMPPQVPQVPPPPGWAQPTVETPAPGQQVVQSTPTVPQPPVVPRSPEDDRDIPF